MAKVEREKKIDSYVEDILAKYNYGDIITLDYLERLFDVRRDEVEFGYLTIRLKNQLIEVGCILSNIVGEGYKILFPSEVPLEVFRRYAKYGVNRFKKGLYILNSVDKSMLTEEEKNQFDSFEKTLATLTMSSENTLLTAQAILGEVKMKELGK